MKIKFYVSPFFIAKHYILKDLKELLKKYLFKWKIIDIWCWEKPYQFLFNGNYTYEWIDFDNFSKNNDYKWSKPDYLFNESYINSLEFPFWNESYDNVVSFQVLEHHKSPEIFVKESFRILKNWGFLLVTVPFLYWIHENPNDFQRYTKYWLIELFSKNWFKIIEIKSQWSLFSTISLLFNQYLDSFASKNKINFIFSILVYFPFLLFQYLSLFLDLIFKSENIVFNYIILLRKNEK